MLSLHKKKHRTGKASRPVPVSFPELRVLFSAHAPLPIHQAAGLYHGTETLTNRRGAVGMISERSIRSGQLMGGWYQCFFRRLDTLSSRREERRYVVVLFPADPA
jgi:hypothetical protein